MRNILGEICKENKNTHLMLHALFSKIEGYGEI